MPDPAVDGRTFLWIPGWIWDAIFKVVQLGVMGYFGQSAVNSIQDNGKHQVEAHEELKAEVSTGLTTVANKVDLNTAVVASKPTAPVIEIREAKPADAKEQSEPPGLDERSATDRLFEDDNGVTYKILRGEPADGNFINP